jgi:hypothetical protein
MTGKDQEVEGLPLSQAAKLLLEECRMVLPGIQALFGFQLIAVFQDKFSSLLTTGEQQVHLSATALVAVAIALVMTPAAYHRQTRPLEVSRAYIRLCSRLLLLSMFPLMLGIALELYLIARIVTDRPAVAGVLSLLMVAIYCLAWLVMPWRRRQADRQERRP